MRALTIGPARILGIDDRVGSIRAGKDADLVLFEGDPLTCPPARSPFSAGGKRL